MPLEPAAHLRSAFLVEDDEAYADALTSLLEALGARVAGRVGSLAELREARAAASAADVVLVDLGLPDSVGEATVVATLSMLPDALVVVLTGLDDHEVGARLIAAGAADYLSKTAATLEALRRSLRYASERHRLKQQLVRENRALDDFAGMLAHDLGAVMRHTQAGALALRDELDAPSEEVRTWLDVLEQAGKRGSRMLRSLLTFARSGGELPLAPVDVDYAVALALHALGGSAPAVRLEGKLPMVLGEEELLADVFLNVLTNAMRHGGSGERHVEIRGEAEGRLARIHIDDDGAGPPPRVLGRIDSAERSLREGGVGLGLAICSRIVSAHRGALYLDRSPLGGARVTLELLAAEPTALTVPEATPDAGGGSVHPRSARPS